MTQIAGDAEGQSAGDKQFVALRLAGELYGLDISHVHTVITSQVITRVPRSPAYVRGVINLRGRVIPVVDLRARFDLPALEEDKERHSRIIIVEADGVAAGLIVDGVSEVLRLGQDRIAPPSHLVATSESECVVGIGRVPSHAPSGAKADPGDRLIVLLDVKKILGHALEPSAAESPSIKAA